MELDLFKPAFISDLERKFAELEEDITAYAIQKIDENKVPDFLIRMGIRYIISKDLAKRVGSTVNNAELEREYKREFFQDLRLRGIAEFQKEANQEHYEVDTKFYNIVLGKYQKYSSALYKEEELDLSPDQ